jgi:TRAP-type C4-dicarboxylate transport system permease small subunit
VSAPTGISRLERVYERVGTVEAKVAATFLVLMVVFIFAGGVSRMFGHPLNWSTDAATCLFAWACFLCADVAWRRNSLMSIELLTSRLSPRLQTMLRLLNHAIISVFLLYIAGLGIWLSWTSRVRSFQGIPEISYTWVTASMPFGAVLLLATTLVKVRNELSGRPSDPSRAADIL